MKITTIISIICIFLAFSSFGLQAQRNSIIGVWHFPEIRAFVEFTETHIYGLHFYEWRHLEYRIVGNKIRIRYYVDGNEYYENLSFRLIERNRLKLGLHDGVVGNRMNVNSRRNRTVAKGLYLPVRGMTNEVLYVCGIEIIDERWARSSFGTIVATHPRHYRIFGNRMYFEGGELIFEINRRGRLRLVYPATQRNVVFERRNE